VVTHCFSAGVNVALTFVAVLVLCFHSRRVFTSPVGLSGSARLRRRPTVRHPAINPTGAP
jgi:hypothetical protein